MKKGIFKGSLEVGDSLLDGDNDKYIVMAILDEAVLLGFNYPGNGWLTAKNWYGYDELIGRKFKFFQGVLKLKETPKK